MDISLRTEGTQGIKTRLANMANALSDFRPVWPEVKALVQRHEAKWLTSEGEGTFAPLAASTIKKDKRRSSHPLDLTGTMWDSLTMDTAYTYFAPEQFRCEVGTSAGWAHWHMFNRAHMPARPPIKFTEQLGRDVGAVLRGHVRGTQMRML
jgi:hypothetical protein